MKPENEGEYFKKILMDFFNQTGGSEEMEKAKEHDGCIGCVHVALASDDYPCSECSCNYTNKYQKREEDKELTRSQIRTCEVDLISREDAMGAVQDHFNADGFKGYYDGQKMMDRITALPSAEPKIGEWIPLRLT